MYKLTIPIPGGTHLEVQVETAQEVFEAVTFWGGLPKVCPVDGHPTKLVHRSSGDEEHDYYEVVSTGPVPWARRCGISNDKRKTLFFREYEPKNPWSYYDFDRKGTVTAEPGSYVPRLGPHSGPPGPGLAAPVSGPGVSAPTGLGEPAHTASPDPSARADARPRARQAPAQPAQQAATPPSASPRAQAILDEGAKLSHGEEGVLRFVADVLGEDQATRADLNGLDVEQGREVVRRMRAAAKARP